MIVFVFFDCLIGGLMVLVKIVVSGGFGVGKMIFVVVVFEVELLFIEVDMIEVFLGVDKIDVMLDKYMMIVVLDFGWISFDEGLRLYLFGILG